MSRDEFPPELTAEAAGRVIHEGLDIASARQQALQAAGWRGGGPTDAAIEDEVRTQLALFHPEQPAELQALRRLALHWMQQLQAFHPHLAGAVWRGIATRHAALQLELYPQDEKEAEITLANLGLQPDIAERPDRHPGRRGQRQEVLVLHERPRIGRENLAAQLGPEVTLHLVLRPYDDLRGALKPDARGQRWRGDLKAVQALVDAFPPAPQARP